MAIREVLIYNKSNVTPSSVFRIRMSFIPYTEKNKKKIGICWIRIRYPGSGSADPAPH